MRNTPKIDDDKLKQVADALGVTEDGLKKFTEETVLYSPQLYLWYKSYGVYPM